MDEDHLDKPLFGAVDRVSSLVGRSFSFLFLICMLIIAWEVIARYVFGAPTIWAHDATTALCAVGFIVSGVYTLVRGQHIRITVLYDLFPAPVKRVLDGVAYAIAIAFLGLLAYQAFGSALKSIRMGETAGTASQIPLPPIIKTALLIAAALMLLQTLVFLARALRRHSPRD